MLCPPCSRTWSKIHYDSARIHSVESSTDFSDFSKYGTFIWMCHLCTLFTNVRYFSIQLAHADRMSNCHRIHFDIFWSVFFAIKTQQRFWYFGCYFRFLGRGNLDDFLPPSIPRTWSILLLFIILIIIIILFLYS